METLVTCDCGNALLSGKCYCARCFELDGDVGVVGDVGRTGPRKKGRAKILEALERPLSVKELVAEISMSRQQIQRIIGVLMTIGAIARRSRDGSNGASWEYVYWRVL